MFKRHLKLAYRILIKNPLNSFITIIGLSVGIGCFLALSLYVYDEHNTDRFHSNFDRTYFVSMDYLVDGEAKFSIPPPSGLFYDLENAANITSGTRVFKSDKQLVASDQKKFNEENIYYVDSAWFEIFDFEYSNQSFSLAHDPSKIIVSETIAEKYFGDNDPVGQALEIGGVPYIIENVILRPKTNSSLNPDFLVSFENRAKSGLELTSYKDGHTPYFITSDQSNIEELANGLQAQLDPNLDGMTVKVSLTAFKDFYFTESTTYRSRLISSFRGNEKYYSIFKLIGILILVIAVINYINLITARATERAKEVGIKKTIGAFRSNLIGQFLLESILITGIAALLAIGFSELIINYFNGLIGKSIDSSILLSIEFIVGYTLAILFLAIIAGLYPAFVLSKFKPIKAINNNLKTSKGSGSWLRNTLITLQFSITTILIFGSVVIINQTSYMMDFDLGFDSDKIISVKASDYGQSHINIIKTSLEKINGVDHVSVGNLPGIGWMFSQKFGDNNVNVALNYVDEDFSEMAGLHVIEGRDFNEEDRGKDNLIINRTLRDLYFGDGPTVFGKLPEKDTYLIGVVDDFYFTSAKNEVRPLELKLHKNEFANILIRLNQSANARNIVSDIEEAMTKNDPENVFEYHFLDQQFDDQFKSDMTFLNLTEFFTTISIFIGVIGLFGLAQFSFLKRVSEFGIRKVLGASSSSIIQILLKGFFKPVLIAAIFGLPIGYYLMNEWLQEYANQIDLSWGIYGVTLLSIVSVALITVLYQIIQAVRLKPVDTLKGE